MDIWNKIENNALVRDKPTLVELFKFALVGSSGMIVDFGTYALLTRVLGLYYIAATAGSTFLAIISNFLLNKNWTFKKGKSGKTFTEYTRFLIVSVVNYFLNIGITYVIVEYTRAESIFKSYEDFFAKAVAIGIVLFSNYFGNKFWTFRD